MILGGCDNIFTPVKATGTPTEYDFNYWLLSRTYLFEEELGNLDPQGDSTELLYQALSDPYTRYVPPTKSEAASISMNTTIVEGDIGLEYALNPEADFPIFIYRVYPQSPAGRAGVPRYGNIISVNGTSLNGMSAVSVYQNHLNQNAEIDLEVAFSDSIKTYHLHKETVYAPTVFVDTIDGVPVISITSFKLNTADQKSGTYGELKAYLDSTKSEKGVRILDLRDNPGGHVNQCIPMADLFVKKGTLSSRRWRDITPDGKATYKTNSTEATPGDAGEDGQFVILANRNSASCAEIFIGAVAQLTDIPIVGTPTFGKGIGQTTWSTPSQALAIITNLEFLPPNGKSYHRTGLEPDYLCEPQATIPCAIKVIESRSGKRHLKKSGFSEPEGLLRLSPASSQWGGALLDSRFLTDHFQ